METPYILFQAGNLKFLILMERVAMVEPSGKVREEGVPVYDFARICGLRQCTSKGDYVLVVELGGKQFGIMTETVEGIRNIPEESVLVLDTPALCQRNMYLAGAVHMEESIPPLVYILDTSDLYEKTMDIEPDYFM